MVLLGVETQVKAHFNLFKDGANLDARGAQFAPNIT
jgi:hypothetical protein